MHVLSTSLYWDNLSVPEQKTILNQIKGDLESTIPNPAILEGWDDDLPETYAGETYSDLPEWLQRNIMFIAPNPAQ